MRLRCVGPLALLAAADHGTALHLALDHALQVQSNTGAAFPPTTLGLALLDLRATGGALGAHRGELGGLRAGGRRRGAGRSNLLIHSVVSQRVIRGPSSEGGGHFTEVLHLSNLQGSSHLGIIEAGLEVDQASRCTLELLGAPLHRHHVGTGLNAADDVRVTASADHQGSRARRAEDGREVANHTGMLLGGHSAAAAPQGIL